MTRDQKSEPTGTEKIGLKTNKNPGKKIPTIKEERSSTGHLGNARRGFSNEKDQVGHLLKNNKTKRGIPCERI